jgi:cell pole-organizing protein PopZ
VGAVAKPVAPVSSGTVSAAAEPKTTTPAPLASQKAEATAVRSDPETTRPKPGAADARNWTTGDQAAPDAGPAATSPTADDTQLLEDILADLLRPMVRKWLDENMTRALEKAVRIEVADGVLDVVSKMNGTTKG